MEEVLSNKTVTDTVTDKKSSFYAPKSCVLNTLAQTYTQKNIARPPPHSRSGVISRAYSFLQASPMVPQTWQRSLNQGARVKSEWMDNEPTKTSRQLFRVLGVSGALHISCGAVALSITTCQYEKRNSQNTHCFLIMLTIIWHLGYRTTMTKRESIFLNCCLGMTAEHIYFILALLVYFW